jgi:hypothetical protein
MGTRPGAACAAMCIALLAATAACSNDGRNDRATTGGSAAGTVAAEIRVTDVELGRGIGADKRVTDETDDFRPNEVVYVSVLTDGSAPSATLTARWTFQDGQLVDETTQTIQPSGATATEFHISKPDGLPAGNYRVQILLNGREVESEEFEVK